MVHILPRERPTAPKLSPGERFVRVTERQIFKNCRRQWHYAFQLKLLPLNAAPDARSLGTAMHSALAAYYLGINPWSVWRVASEGLDSEQKTLGAGMLKGYIRFAREADA